MLLLLELRGELGDLFGELLALGAQPLLFALLGGQSRFETRLRSIRHWH
jgi:hypothetical protein